MADRRTRKAVEPVEPTEPVEPSEPTEEVEEGEPTPEPGFENRAARRARKKGAQPPKAAERIDPHGSRRHVEAPRTWAARRSG